LLEHEVRKNLNRLAGCVNSDPKTGEVAAACKDDAYILTTTANLLVVADVLVLNEGFANANPKIVAGLVDGLLVGNNMVRTEPAKHAALIERAFGWESGDAISELKKVHLANYPENEAFFNGTIDSAGSFKYLFETATTLYRPQLAAPPISGDTLLYVDALKAAAASNAFANQRADITPIKIDVDLGESSTEDLAKSLLSKNVRIEFMPNSSEGDAGKNGVNDTAMGKIVDLMRVSPGSVVLFRGHADNLKLEDYKKRPDHDPKKVRDGELRLKALSEERCKAVKEILVKNHNAEEGRVRFEGVGVGEATGDAEFDRRVEVQWFTK
jgi:NitT/TauT family transport system substrate-binding protein